MIFFVLNKFDSIFYSFLFQVSSGSPASPASSDPVDVALEKLLRVVESVMDNTIYNCHHDKETTAECTSKYPTEKVTQEEIDAVRTALLAEQLDAGTVDKFLSYTFQRFASNLDADSILLAAVRV